MSFCAPLSFHEIGLSLCFFQLEKPCVTKAPLEEENNLQTKQKSHPVEGEYTSHSLLNFSPLAFTPWKMPLEQYLF